jgi:hypothetical protein
MNKEVLPKAKTIPPTSQRATNLMTEVIDVKHRFVAPSVSTCPPGGRRLLIALH